MKLFKKTHITLLLAALVMFSCSEDYFDVNDSQDFPTTSTPQLTLPVAQKRSADYYSGGTASLNTLGNLWGYVWAAAGDFIFFTDEMQYNVNSSFRTASFEVAYDVMTNYNYVETFGAEDDIQYNNYKAIAKIMKAFHFQYLVDQYGSVPYTEAFQGGSNTTPAYDEGKFIYDAIYQELLNAQDLITASMGDDEVISVGSEDIMLGGDMVQWAKFANSLKLRILLRQTETSESFATQYTELNGNQYGFIGVGETVTVNPGYSQDAGKQNPLFGSFGKNVSGNNTGNFDATTPTPYVLDKLDSYNDIRKSRLYRVAASTGTFVGNEQNNQVATAPKTGDLSKIGPGILKDHTQDAVIMLSSESLFLQAEANQRMLLTNGSAQAFYESAIVESFKFLGVPATVADPTTTPPTVAVSTAQKAMNYYNQNINNVGFVASTNKIEAIITQKWIALNGNQGIELWIEYKRTGFPADLPAAPDALQSTIPVRLLYPTSEQATNPDNVPTQTTGDAFNSPVFWDN